jgi:hypothetical protein
MTNRRKFIKQISAAGVISTIPDIFLPPLKNPDNKIWGCLLHLSFNMWEEYVSPHRPFRGYKHTLELSEPLWNDALAKMVSEGMNMVLIDIGNAVRFESHPEIAVNKAWSVTRLRDELQRIRKMGLEPIPKLNFSATHDAWLNEYSRMVSTDKYYSVCSDLIKEVNDLFGKPRFFHLGYDEETAAHQEHFRYMVVRQNDCWWKDFLFFADEVLKNGSRPWIWSDYMWHHPDLFFKNMPKSVVQSNWYYGEKFEDATTAEEKSYVKSYIDLETHGYDQIPTGSYLGSGAFAIKNDNSILKTVQFCEKNINDTRLLGFLQTFWKPTLEENRDRIINGIELAGGAKKWFIKNH